MASFMLSLQFNKQICKKHGLVIGFVSFLGFSLWLVYSSIYMTLGSNAKVECKLLKLIIKHSFGATPFMLFLLHCSLCVALCTLQLPHCSLPVATTMLFITHCPFRTIVATTFLVLQHLSHSHSFRVVFLSYLLAQCMLFFSCCPCCSFHVVALFCLVNMVSPPCP